MPKKAAWTVMVYLAGDNNLTTECLFALTEMKKALPGDEINVVAQFDPQDAHVPTHRYEINRAGPNTTLFDDIIDEAHFDPRTREVCFKKESDNANAFLSSRVVRRELIRQVLDEKQDLTVLAFEEERITDETDTGSPITLYNFLSFCLQEYPAEHYLIVLSGHSGGTNSDYLLTDTSPRGSLTFNELKTVFKELQKDLNGQKIDIIGMDHCLMSMAEVCYELRGSADFLVGCESFSPASGWPYKEILQRLKTDLVKSKKGKKKSIVENFAKAIVEEYTNYYSGYWMSGLSVSQSALDLRKVDQLGELVNRLGSVLEKQLLDEYQPESKKRKSKKTTRTFSHALLLAHWEAQSYNGELFVDLYDLCSCLETHDLPIEITKVCSEVKKFIETKLVLKSCFVGAAYQYSYGLSIYFPWSQVANSYWNLDFVKASMTSGWGSFLNSYTVVTRREPRGGNKRSKLNAIQTVGLDQRIAETRMMTDRMMTDRMMTDRMMTDRMMTDRMMTDRMSSDSSGNPIQSMRNPPLVFFPPNCVKEHRELVAVQERFWGTPKTRRLL